MTKRPETPKEAARRGNRAVEALYGDIRRDKGREIPVSLDEPVKRGPIVNRQNPNDSERAVSIEIEAVIKESPLVYMCERRNSGSMNIEGDFGQDNRYVNFSRFIKRPSKDKMRVPDYVGTLIDGRAFAIEAKRRDWKLTDSDWRAHEQLAYMNAVIRAGGKAGFAICGQDAKDILDRP